jgi:heat shock protein HtpX
MTTGVDPSFAGRVSGNQHRAVGLVAVTAAVTGVVLGLLTLLLAGPIAAVLVAVVVAAAVSSIAWWGSEPLALRLIDARAADPVDQARLFNLVEGLCANAGVPQPELFVVADAGLNALTMGRSPRHATLVVTSGLLEHLSRIELEAVLAHELSHVKSDDILTATLAVALFGLLHAPARAAVGGGPGAVAGYLLLPLSVLAGIGLRLSVGPQREELADSSGVSLTRYPPALVSALEKLRRSGTVVRAASPATAHLWLGAAVPPPPSTRLRWLSRLYDTHPPLDERIEALREL